MSTDAIKKEVERVERKEEKKIADIISGQVQEIRKLETSIQKTFAKDDLSKPGADIVKLNEVGASRKKGRNAAPKMTEGSQRKGKNGNPKAAEGTRKKGKNANSKTAEDVQKKGKNGNPKTVEEAQKKGKNAAPKAAEITSENEQNAILRAPEVSPRKATVLHVPRISTKTASFEYLKKLGEITKNLFALGSTDLESNHAVVKELEQALEGTSHKQFGELARQEIENVIQQLKVQEEILELQADPTRWEHQLDEMEAHQQVKFGQNTLAQTTKQQDNTLEKGVNMEKNLTLLEQKMEELNRLIEEGDKRFNEHARLLEESEARDQAQDKEIEALKQRDKEFDKLIHSANEQIAEAQQQAGNYTFEIETLNSRVNDLDYNKADKKMAYIAVAISIVALLAAVSQIMG